MCSVLGLLHIAALQTQQMHADMHKLANQQVQMTLSLNELGILTSNPDMSILRSVYTNVVGG